MAEPNTLFAALNATDAKTEWQRLAEQLEHHDKLYYQQDAPELSDAEYDVLRRQLETLEQQFPDLKTKQSPTQKVGAAPLREFKKSTHRQPMLSLSNIFSREEFEEFTARIKRFLNLSEADSLVIMAEPKIDGLAMNLLYEDGKLIKAATRGDGTIGEDVTPNVMTIKNVPHILTNAPKGSMEIRGEVYIESKAFQQLNVQREENGDAVFANPRNAAAGSLRQLDPNITASRPLKFFAYAINTNDAGIEALYSTQSGLRDYLQQWGFETNEPSLATADEEAIWSYFQTMMAKRHDLLFEIDGIVYKVDDLKWQERLGTVARSPRWATAHKFPAELAETIIEKIVIQVGRTGTLTPVAELKPVAVGGVIVSRATLHNEDEINRKDVRVGDSVILQRAGDVIPQILRPVLEKRPADSAAFIFPDHCPECGSLAVRKDGEVAKRCTGGLICPAQAIEHIKHFISRDALNVDGLGERTIRDFFARGWVKRPSDLFALDKHKDELLTLEGWGEKSVVNLFDALDKVRSVTLDKFIYALGIRQIGQTTARKLAQFYGTWENMLQLMLAAQDQTDPAYADLIAIESIGAAVAADLLGFFAEAHNRVELAALESQMTILPFVVDIAAHAFLTGKIVVFTGTLEKMTRAEAKATAERLGAKVAGSVSKKTDYLVAGAAAGSKLKEATAMGVKTLSEDEWLEMLASI